MEFKFKPSVNRVLFPSMIIFIFFIIIFIIGIGIINLVPQVDYYTKLAGNSLIVFLILVLITSFVNSIGKVRNTTYFINKKFITRNKKFISEIQEDIPIGQITNVDYRISFFLDKLFGTGSIAVYTSGSNSADINISGIKDVVKIYEGINNLLKLNKSIELNAEGEVRGTHQKIEESKLVERIKPSAGIATAFSVFSTFISFIMFGVYVLIDSRIALYSSYPILSIFMVLVVSIIWLFIAPFFTYKAYKKKYYDFYTDKLEYYDGFFNLHKATIPLERITNISLHKGLIEMIVGVSRIDIETAGSSGAEIKISYVKNGEAIIANLKEVLKKHGRN
ncbi:MAG: PH domain-containing protein [Candidatus Woesearchaeota archaeon]|jgi:membrane protein YdbS with pleckstrin-like domain|nr:PH domain-containing protein [Candidatus Woesearchaeota archaeon]